MRSATLHGIPCKDLLQYVSPIFSQNAPDGFKTRFTSQIIANNASIYSVYDAIVFAFLNEGLVIDYEVRISSSVYEGGHWIFC